MARRIRSWLVLGALGLASAALRGPIQTRADVIDRVAATVDEVAIAESDIRKAIVVGAVRPEAGESAGAFRSRVLDALIDQRLQYREALRFGPPTPEPQDVDAALRRLKDRLRAQGKDPAREFVSAGMTEEEVRSALERQIVVQRYLEERFRPVAVADEDRAREEYEKFYVPERRAAGEVPRPFESVADDMRRNSQQRVYDEEADRWMKEIRQKARISIFPDDRPSLGADRTPIPLSVTPAPGRPVASPSPTPG